MTATIDHVYYLRESAEDADSGFGDACSRESALAVCGEVERLRAALVREKAWRLWLDDHSLHPGTGLYDHWHDAEAATAFEAKARAALVEEGLLPAD